MQKLKSKILQMNFPKFFKGFLIVALVALLLGGVSLGVGFRTQISQVVSYARQAEPEKAQPETDVQEHAVAEQKKQGEHRDHQEKDFLENAPITEPSFGAKLTLALFGLLYCLLFAVYWLMAAAWLYQAAVLAHTNGFVWLLAGLIGNVFAGVLFLLFRSITRKKCPACGKWLSSKAKYCVHCGEKLYVKCPACGKECRHEDQFCSACGHRLQETQEAAN